MRKLASVRIISDLKPIFNADLIELAIIDGWQVVVKKGQFKIGDKCIYCEIDSLLPIKSEYDFLKNCYKKYEAEGKIVEGYRIKSIKIRKCLSQGIIFPLDKDFEVDTDLTDYLGIIKYDPPENEYVQQYGFKSKFPEYIRKTDEERLQNIPWILNNTDVFYVTEKLDGSSFTVFQYKDGEVEVCSRNNVLDKTVDNNYTRVYKKYPKLSEIKNLCIQGEMVGGKIQGGKYKIPEPDLYVFSIFDIEKQCYLNVQDQLDVCTKLDLKHVPVLDQQFKLKSLQEMLEYANGESKLYPTKREGIVVRNYNKTVSFKVISNDFLLSE